MGIVRRSFYVAPSVKSLGAAVFFLVGCSGGAFEGSPTGSELAGAAGDAAAGSIGTGGSSVSGAAGVAGKPTPANEGGAGGELEQPAGAGAGGELEQPAAVACDRSSWKLEAFASWQAKAELPALALDGDAETRWSSGAPREAGQWLALELGAAQTLEALELRTPATPGDLPSSLVVKLDGEPKAATFEAGDGVLRVSFAAQRVSAVRLELDAGAVSWWSVAELGGLCR